MTNLTPEPPDYSSPVTPDWWDRPSSAAWSKDGFENLLTATRDQLDLRDQAAVNYWFRANRPEYIFLVAGTVGGIMANSSRPGRIHLRQHDDPRHSGARRPPAQRCEASLPRLIVHLPSRGCPTHGGGVRIAVRGPLEPTNEPYAIAKIAGIKLCQAYRVANFSSNFIPPCPPISTDPMTTSTCSHPTCCRR